MEIMEHPQTNSTEPGPTDLLLSLPPELLLPIFSFVGVENFRQDARPLAVCKKWYAYARPIFLGNLRLWDTDLLPMLRAMRKDETLAAVQQVTKHVQLTMLTRPTDLFMYPPVPLLEWLASRLKVFTALRTLVVRSRGSTLFMDGEIFSSLATLHQLTSLEMDLENVRISRIGVHLCESISRLIPTLKSLRCRLPRICHKLLDLSPGDLQELVIIIFRTNSDSRHSDTEDCSTGCTLNDDRYRAALEARLVQFAASMSDPKTVRAFHRFQNLHKTYAFDAIKKRRFLLGFCPAWDADGVLLPEDWEESEESEENEEINEELSEEGELSEDEESDE